MYTQLEQRSMAVPPVNIASLKKMKLNGEAIACITAYDASFALTVDHAGADLVLVGDSLGMVIQGHDTTVPVTVDDVIYHTRNVSRGLHRAFLVADMPFMTYSDPNQALENAVRLMQEGHVTRRRHHAQQVCPVGDQIGIQRRLLLEVRLRVLEFLRGQPAPLVHQRQRGSTYHRWAQAQTLPSRPLATADSNTEGQHTHTR